jgi:hypothetical protein
MEQQRILENGDAQDLENRVEVQGCPVLMGTTPSGLFISNVGTVVMCGCGKEMKQIGG